MPKTSLGCVQANCTVRDADHVLDACVDDEMVGADGTAALTRYGPTATSGPTLPARSIARMWNHHVPSPSVDEVRLVVDAARFTVEPAGVDCEPLNAYA